MNLSLFTLEGIITFIAIAMAVLVVMRMSERCKSILMAVLHIAQQNREINERLERIEKRLPRYARLDQ